MECPYAQETQLETLMMKAAHVLLFLFLSALSVRAQTTFSDVHPVFVTRCYSCHTLGGYGGLAIGDSNINLAYSDSQLPSYYSPGQTKGYASLIRILDGTMPLVGGCTGDPTVDAGNPACATAEEISLLQSWITDGQLGPTPSTGISFCDGDGSGTGCPCNNSGISYSGCAHSASELGARLQASGTASITSDTLLLKGSRLPNTSAVFVQGTQQANGGLGTVFGDGLLCVGGSLVRLGTRIPSGGIATYPQPGEASVSLKGLVPSAGTVRHYQVLFRNPGSYCVPATSSGSNGIRITWTL
jgi:hypothetical protein